MIPFTPRAKKVLELALREAVKLGHTHIGTEHILLGIVREKEGVAARILVDFDADADKVRGEILRTLSIPRPYLQPGEAPLEHLDVAPDFEEEIMRVRRAKERAIEQQSFVHAGRLAAPRRRRRLASLRRRARARPADRLARLGLANLRIDSRDGAAEAVPRPGGDRCRPRRCRAARAPRARLTSTSATSSASRGSRRSRGAASRRSRSTGSSSSRRSGRRSPTPSTA